MTDDGPDPIFDPGELRHPKLQAFAVWTSRVSVLAETVRAPVDLNLALTPEECMLLDLRKPSPWESDAVSVAHAVVQGARDQSLERLEQQVANWISEDRENWPVVRLALIEPWLERPGSWSAHTPEWVRILAASATTAYENQQPGQPHPPD